MIKEMKYCSRCRKNEGDEFKDGTIVSFQTTPSEKRCDRCYHNSKHRNDLRVHYAKNEINTPFEIGVYCLKEGKELLYIGSSDNLPFRLYKHYQLNNSFKDGLNKLQRKFRYTWHIMWHGDSLADAQHQEKALIQIHNPRYNKIKYKHYAA